MTQYQLTLDRDTVQRLFGDQERLRQLLEAVVNQVLEAQMSEHLQAESYERTLERRGYRNGYKPRQFTTRVGALQLRVPQARDGSVSPELFERYERSEQALVCTLMEMVVNGVSTRKVAQITEELCGKAFSKSTVSELCQRLDPLVSAWNERSLAEQRYPFVLVDALVVKVREEGRVRARSALVALGVNEAGYREILGLQLGDSESERSWMEFFVWLKDRGLSGVDLVVSDHHGGLVKAVRRHFQGATWQRCQTHLSANVSDATPKALQETAHRRVRAIFEAPDLQTARVLLAALCAEFQRTAPAAVATLERGFDDATAILSLPEPYRRRLRTTNAVERLNKEIRRRERVIRIFPNRDAVLRLVGALLMEQDEVWTTGKRYFDMTAYWQGRGSDVSCTEPTQEAPEASGDASGACKQRHWTGAASMTTLLERYVQGDHERVWEELVAVGEAVREEPLYTDAVAVARETMRRARHNLEALIPRLATLGYQFGYGWIQPAPATAFGWRERASYRERLHWAHTQPPILRLATDALEELADRRRRLARLQERGAAHVLLDHQEQRIAALQAQTPVTSTLDEFEQAVGTLPVSVRSWYETVAQVNFVGAHPAWLRFLDPDTPEEAADRLEEGGSPYSALRPLVVSPVDSTRITDASGAELRRSLPFIPNEHAAYGDTSQQAFDYPLTIPCLDADARLHLEDEETTFVAHLRKCFRWGGFPGWAQQDQRPEGDLLSLTRDLLPI